MYKSILVCLDGSPQDGPVIDCAVWLAERLKATLHGLHVKDVLTLEGPLLYDISGALSFIPQMNFLQETRKILEQKGKNILSGFEKRCQEQGVSFQTYLEEGIVHRTIANKAELHDLTLLGRRGLNYNFERDLMGSTTERVVRRTKAPTLAVTHEFTDIHSPLLAFDGSHEARKALTSTVRLLSELKLPLTVLNVNNNQEEGRKILAEAKEHLESYPLVVKYDLIPGTPRHEVPDYAKRHKHDLIILGARGHRGIVDFIIGSTTEYVLWQGTAHVLVDR
jgi:nucleotide-binding universal stress UspA family protein